MWKNCSWSLHWVLSKFIANFTLWCLKNISMRKTRSNCWLEAIESLSSFVSLLAVCDLITFAEECLRNSCLSFKSANVSKCCTFSLTSFNWCALCEWGFKSGEYDLGLIFKSLCSFIGNDFFYLNL